MRMVLLRPTKTAQTTTAAAGGKQQFGVDESQRGGAHTDRVPTALLAQTDENPERVLWRARVRVLHLHTYADFIRATREVCSAATQVMGSTVGFYHTPGQAEVEYVLLNTPRRTYPLTYTTMRDNESRWVILDALLRLSYRLGFFVTYVSLLDPPPDRHSWMWPLVARPFQTSWMSLSTHHYVLIEQGAAAMLVISRYVRRTQLLDADRGGHPQLTDEGLHNPVRVTDEGQRNAARPPPRVRLCTSHVLLVPRSVYDLALPVAMGMLSRVLQTSLTLEVDSDLLLFFGRGIMSHHGVVRTFAMPDADGVRVLVMDLLIRASWALSLDLLCYGLSGNWQDPEFLPPRTFSTRWAASASIYVALVDHMHQEVYVLFRRRRMAISDRGGYMCTRKALIIYPSIESGIERGAYKSCNCVNYLHDSTDMFKFCNPDACAPCLQ
eukprot:4421891-Amphidinium_carterae.3